MSKQIAGQETGLAQGHMAAVWGVAMILSPLAFCTLRRSCQAPSVTAALEPTTASLSSSQCQRVHLSPSPAEKGARCWRQDWADSAFSTLRFLRKGFIFLIMGTIRAPSTMLCGMIFETWLLLFLEFSGLQIHRPLSFHDLYTSYFTIPMALNLFFITTLLINSSTFMWPAPMLVFQTSFKFYGIKIWIRQAWVQMPAHCVLASNMASNHSPKSLSLPLWSEEPCLALTSSWLLWSLGNKATREGYISSVGRRVRMLWGALQMGHCGMQFILRTSKALGSIPSTPLPSDLKYLEESK